MHRLWDGDMLARAEADEDRWLADLISLDTPEARTKAMAGTVEDWATESLRIARRAYQDPATGQKVKKGQKLADAYQVANLPIARQRLYQAGIRLAMVLNEVFPER
jgi:nuclease S1